MLVHLFLSDSALQRIIKIRLLSEFRPIDEPITYNQQQCLIDRFRIDDVQISTAGSNIGFTLNHVDPTGTSIIPSGSSFGIAPVVAIIRGSVLLTPIASVVAAGKVQPDTRYGLPDEPTDLAIPIINAQFNLFFTVSPLGVATLNLQLVSLPGSENLGDAKSFLDAFSGLTIPFAVNSAFEPFLAPNKGMVVNAGVVSQANGIAIRLEFEPLDGSPAGDIARLNEWSTFFAGQYPSQLQGRDWAFELPTSEMAKTAGKQVDDQFQGPDVAKFFTSTGNASGGFFPGWPGTPLLPQNPGFSFKKEGIIESACAGLDIRAEIDASIELSVPAPNVLRVSGNIDIDLNDWDSFKCIGISLINPFAGILTTYDWGAPWWAFLPISIILPLAPIVFGLGGDDFIVKEAIKSAQSKNKAGQPAIVRTSKTSFYVDLPQQITTDITRDWVVIQAVRGNGDRLILTGDFTAPDINTLPRLRGTLVDGFEGWKLQNKCSSNVKYTTLATIKLSLEDADNGAPVYKPFIPVRYGIDIEKVNGVGTAVGQVTWRIIEDPQGIYQGNKTRIHWSGLPGTFEVQVDHPPEPFASAPYPCRIQFYTSVGVREFEIPAPKPLPKPPTTQEAIIAAAAERISSCYVFTSLISMIKALQVHWLPMPNPEQKVAQHWQFAIEGLNLEDRITAWDPSSGQRLAEVRSYLGGIAEISLVLPAELSVKTLQLTLNDAPLMNARDYYRRVSAIEPREMMGPNPVFIRQTTLYPVAHVELNTVASELSAHRMNNSILLRLDSQMGGIEMEFDLLDPSRNQGFRINREAERVVPQVPSRQFRTMLSEREGVRVAEIVGRGMPSDELVVARYFARPWYDRGGQADRFFAQLSDDGTAVTLYKRGPTLDVEPDVREE